MKSAKLEWALDALPEALTLVQEGLTKFQDSDKLWMMKGQLQVNKEYYLQLGGKHYRRKRLIS